MRQAHGRQGDRGIVARGPGVAGVRPQSGDAGGGDAVRRAHGPVGPRDRGPAAHDAVGIAGGGHDGAADREVRRAADGAADGAKTIVSVATVFFRNEPPGPAVKPLKVWLLVPVMVYVSVPPLSTSVLRGLIEPVAPLPPKLIVAPVLTVVAPRGVGARQRRVPGPLAVRL